MKSWFRVLVWLLLNVASAGRADLAGQARASGVSGGVCVFLGAPDAEAVLALAQQGSWVVQCLAPDEASGEALRSAIRGAGLYGRVSAEAFQGRRLPYVDHFVNLLVTSGSVAVPEAEIRRVLVPHGVAFALDPASKEATRGLVKPWPAGIDEWTHFLHGPDGNPVAEDRVVGPPEHFQWIQDPPWLRSHETDSSLSTLVTAQGRLFAIVDEAPVSLVGQHSLPDKWCLLARDAFNGTLLWKVPIRRWGWREWKDTWFTSRPGDIPLNIQKRLVAAGDKVYVTLGYQAPVSQLDARTGEILQSYAGTERTNEILFENGVLVLSILSGEGARVMAVNPADGQTLWTSAKSFQGTTTDYIKWVISPVSRTIPKLDPALNLATDGRTIALIDGTEIVALDVASGAETWRAAFPLEEEDRTRGSGVDLWSGTMIVRDGVVLHASPSKMAAFAADSGKVLWSQPKKYLGHLWYEWKDIFVIDGLVWTWTADLGSDSFEGGPKGKQVTLYPKSIVGYDLKTGELKREVPTGAIYKANHHHRCYRNKATSRFILTSRRGTEFVDLEGGEHSVHNWVRGTCHVGMMPANGLQYVPPHPCACYLDEKLTGFLALAPAGSEEKGALGQAPAAGAAERLQRGPAVSEPGTPGVPALPAPADWPAFRHDANRSGVVDTQVPDKVSPLWRVKLGSSPTPAVAVGDQVIAAAGDEHRVVCLNARDGRQIWEFIAGGRIDSSPTWHNGSVLFGSADGWVYCLRARDGALRWRFQAAPADRRIGAFGQIECAWPVHGSVLVMEGKAYCAAGRSSELDGGIWLFALDAATGEVKAERRLEGPDYTANAAGKLVMQPPPESGPGEFDANHQLPMGALSDVLTSDGQRIFMRSAAFDLQLRPHPGGKPELLVRPGYLDGSYFSRTPWSSEGEQANLIVRDKDSVYFVRQFESLKNLDPTVYFTPGAKGYMVFAKNVGGKKNTWLDHVPVRIQAMVLAGGRLFLAGPPDVVDPKDPLGAFENRMGGLLLTVDIGSGARVAEQKLDAPPVFNGLAAARGRLFLSTTLGELLCFGVPDDDAKPR